MTPSDDTHTRKQKPLPKTRLALTTIDGKRCQTQHSQTGSLASKHAYRPHAATPVSETARLRWQQFLNDGQPPKKPASDTRGNAGRQRDTNAYAGPEWPGLLNERTRIPSYGCWLYDSTSSWIFSARNLRHRIPMPARQAAERVQTTNRASNVARAGLIAVRCTLPRLLDCHRSPNRGAPSSSSRRTSQLPKTPSGGKIPERGGGMRGMESSGRFFTCESLQESTNHAVMSWHEWVLAGAVS